MMKYTCSISQLDTCTAYASLISWSKKAAAAAHIYGCGPHGLSLLMTGDGLLGPSEDAWEDDVLDAFARIGWSLIPSL